MRIASWNVNGIRACYKSGLMPWLKKSKCDVLLLQEVRAEAEQIPSEIAEVPGFKKLWISASIKKGYSGVGLFSRESPIRVLSGMGIDEFDREGRVLGVELKNCVVVSAYFPNSQEGGKRVDYKVRFCEAAHEWLDRLRKKGKPVIIGGDFNIAPNPIDLARPKENEGSAGYLPEERRWMNNFLASGWVDSFRELHPEAVKYSWWSARTNARERNIGWRIDFLVVHKKEKDRIRSADIENDIYGSDHCPVNLEIAL